MALAAKERKELIATALEHLANVIGASGKAEELVRITTLIVQACKRLAEATSEPTKTNSTAVLAEFVIAAKAIAKDTRAVDSNSLQQLSSKKRAVEALVKELEQWHISHCSKSDDIEILSHLVRESPPSSPLTEFELKLLYELNRQRVALLGKKEPQKAPDQHGQPEDVLKTTSKGLTRAADALVSIASQKNPRKDLLLDSTILLAKMVSVLLDLVDSLFVSKYPMRAQVHSFCCTLIDDGLAYKDQSKTADVATLKDVCTQTPALMSAAEVMTEQCYKRSQNIKENQQMSIQRNSELYSLDVSEPRVAQRPSPSMPKRKPDLPKPKPKEQDCVAFEICCMICTNVAVDKQSDMPIAKGTAINFEVTSTTTVKDVRRLLSNRTGINVDHIEVKFQGDDVLSDDLSVTPDNPVPYFMFNLCEPGDEELKEIRKNQRRKHLLKIEDKDWWRKVTLNTVAVAMYDYEALGADGNLEFDEGDIVEIVEKSADGWWTGRMGDESGVFPASFVEEIEVPKSKDEQKKLLKKFRQGKLVGGVSDSQIETISSPPPLSSHASEGRLNVQSPVNSYGRSSPQLGRGFKRVQSATYEMFSNPRSPPKLSRLPSDPLFGQYDSSFKDGKSREKGSKRLSLFNKKKDKDKPVPIIEEQSISAHGRPHSPLISTSPDKKKRPFFPELDGRDTVAAPFLQGATKPLVRPASSPRVTKKKADGGPRRAPPPVPKPYTGTAMSNLRKNKSEDSRLSEDDSGGAVERLASEMPPTSPPLESPTSPAGDAGVLNQERSGMKSSGSMEELMRNLEEFDEFSSTTSLTNGHKEQSPRMDYGTIPDHEIPTKKEPKTEVGSSCLPSGLSSNIPPVIITGSPSPSPRPESPTPDSKPPAKPPRAKRRGTVPEVSDAQSPPERRSTDLPLLKSNEDGLDQKSSESHPKPPPRTKNKKARSKRMMDKITHIEKERSDGRAVSPKLGKKAPILPPKPKDIKASLVVSERQECSSAPVSRTGSPEDALLKVGGKLAKELSASSDVLQSGMEKPRSPVVMRRMGVKEPQYSDEALGDCTGIGKEGVLHREATLPRGEWKPQYFKLLHKSIVYYEGNTYSEDMKSLGKILSLQMKGAVCVGETAGYQCFAIKMRDDTSVVLGCYTAADMNDWVHSITKMIKMAPMEISVKGVEHGACYYNTALKCISYLSGAKWTDDYFVAAKSDQNKIRKWLEQVDHGHDADLSSMPDGVTATALLRAILDKDRLGPLVPSALSYELCELVKSADPVSILSSKLQKLPADIIGLLRKLLRLFAQVLEKDQANLSKVNSAFGSLLFEQLSLFQSEQLLAYFISTCELVFI